MFATKQLEDLAKKLFLSLPTNVQNIDGEIQQQFNDILRAAFTKLDLVTREEFDVQVKVLARTREKVEKLESEISKLTQN
ncbi:MAG: accessory factor UbiK family protein [Legionellaceae bacterium]|nr:accessory factor UbiK family protein [Legionellaceae bacterium]